MLDLIKFPLKSSRLSSRTTADLHQPPIRATAAVYRRPLGRRTDPNGRNLTNLECFWHQKHPLQAKFPGATVIASTLDAYVDALWGVKETLPVITQEVADSWIWGCAQDPDKQTTMRALMRARSATVAAGGDDAASD